MFLLNSSSFTVVALCLLITNIWCFSCFHSNLGWLYYGLLKSDQTLIVVNIIGALLQILYIIVFLYYTKQKVSEVLHLDQKHPHWSYILLYYYCVTPVYLSLSTSAFVVSEERGVPDSCSGDSADLLLVLLCSNSSWGRHSAEPAGPRLQRGDCQHVPVAAHWPGTAYTTYRQHAQRHVVFSRQRFSHLIEYLI